MLRLRPIVATTPLTDNEVWTTIPPGSLMLFVDGAPLDQGPSGTCAFVPASRETPATLRPA